MFWKGADDGFSLTKRIMFTDFPYGKSDFFWRNMKKNLQDCFGRKIDYLRVSLTDACNFRCIYCVSPGSVEKITADAILTRDEILRFVGLAASLGIKRI